MPGRPDPPFLMQEDRLTSHAISRRTFVTGGLLTGAATAFAAHWWLRGRFAWHREPVVEGHATVGAPAPRFTLEQLRNRGSISLPREEEPLLLAFSATWCLTCVAELRNFQAVDAMFRGKARIVVVNFQQARLTILSLVDRLDVPDVSILLDSTGAVTRAYRVTALPAMALVDGQGIVRAVGNEYLSVERIIERMAEVGAVPIQ